MTKLDIKSFLEAVEKFIIGVKKSESDLIERKNNIEALKRSFTQEQKQNDEATNSKLEMIKKLDSEIEWRKERVQELDALIQVRNSQLRK